MNSLFHERIREIKEMTGATSGKLAKALEVSEPTVALWLTGKSTPNYIAMQKIGDVLGTDAVLYLLGLHSDYLACHNAYKRLHIL